MNAWFLPTQVSLGGRSFRIYTDYRDILEIIGYLENPDLPEFLRWRIALALFYEEEIPPKCQQEAMQYLADFIACGDARPGPKLLDWEQDARAIVADVNKVAGVEIRAVQYLHWWTFLAYFHAIGEGQLSQLVAIRDKLRRGKRLEKWEQTFYQDNRERVELKRKLSSQELEEQTRLKALLGEDERK